MTDDEVVTEITILPPGASIEDPDVSTWSVTVCFRGRGLHGVYWMGRCLSRSGEWDWEPMPSGREGGWLAEHRFALPDALAAARAAVGEIVVNGMTWAEAVVWREGRR